MNDNEIATSQIFLGCGDVGNTKGLLYTNECVDSSSIVGCTRRVSFIQTSVWILVV